MSIKYFREKSRDDICMKIIVVSGFLGAGKTTFIKQVLKCITRNIIVLENEYAESNIDKLELSSSIDEKKIWELTEGCICCNRKESLIQSIISIASVLSPEYLIIESTGLAELQNIIYNIKRIEYEYIKYCGAITIVDLNMISTCLKEKIFLNQIKYADAILLSKTKYKSRSEIESCRSFIHQLNASAQIKTDDFRYCKKEWFERLWNTLENNHEIPVYEDLAHNMVRTVYETVPFHDVIFPDISSMMIFFTRTVRGYYGKIVRAKGFVLCAKSWIKFDISNNTYTIEPSGKAKINSAVFIGSYIKKNILTKDLNFDTSKCYRKDKKRIIYRQHIMPKQ